MAAGDWPHDAPPRGDSVTIPTIRLAVALSLLLHAAVLWWPGLKETLYPLLDPLHRGRSGGSLVVNLPQPGVAASPAAAAPATARAPASSAAPPANRAARAVAARRPALPSVPQAENRRIQSAPSAPAQAAQASEETPAPPSAASASGPAEATDLASYIAARRRARGEPESAPAGDGSAPPREQSERERANLAVASRLGLRATPTFGDDPQSGGGVFQIQRIGFDDADFLFYGWDKDIQRNARQLIETRKGDASDIRIAVVRRMIGIIREREPGEFVWVSRRLGRQVTLSAAAEDNAGLEDFLMHEFFGTDGTPR